MKSKFPDPWKFTHSHYKIKCDNCQKDVKEYWYSDGGEVNCDICQREKHPYMFWGEKKKVVNQESLFNE